MKNDLMEQCPKERVCLWFREVGKEGGEARVEGALTPLLFEAVRKAREELLSMSAPPSGSGFLRLQRAILDASASGSTLERGKALSEARGREAP